MVEDSRASPGRSSGRSKSVAVKVVGATARDHVDDGAVIATVFRCEAIGDDPELFGRVWVCDCDSTQSPGTSVSLLSAPSSMKLLLRSRAPLAEIPPRPSDWVTPGRQQHQLVGITQDQGKFRHLLMFHYVAELSIRRVHRRRLPSTMTCSWVVPTSSLALSVTA